MQSSFGSASKQPLRWDIGGLEITRIAEIESTGGSRFILPEATKEAAMGVEWLYPWFADERGRLKMSVHCYIIETRGGTRICVDTCIGNDKPRDIPTW